MHGEDISASLSASRPTEFVVLCLGRGLSRVAVSILAAQRDSACILESLVFPGPASKSQDLPPAASRLQLCNCRDW